MLRHRGGYASNANKLRLTATTAGAGQTVTLQRITHSRPSTVQWGDGAVDSHGADYTGPWTHTYTDAGTYEVCVHHADRITGVDLRDSKISGLNTVQLRRSVLTRFWATGLDATTANVIRSADMINWRPTLWYLYSMPAGAYDIDSAHMVDWRPTLWSLRSMPAGTYDIDSAHMVDWRPLSWYLFLMPAGTYDIDSADMVDWRPTNWRLYSMPAGTYDIDSADMVDWRPLYLWLYSMPAAGSSYAFAATCMRNWTGAELIYCQDLGLLQATVDAIIADVWVGRAGYTYATPELNVGGTNATPTGVYQDGYPLPLTALEAVHDLVNDDDAAGINTWSVTWNGGSAP